MTKLVLSVALLIAGAAVATLAILHYPRAEVAVQRAVRPGELSGPHAFLENNCAACHTAIKGVEAKNCIVCHADNLAVLQRQPSAFHADIASCTACHLEHQGRVPSGTKMDHIALARLGAQQSPVTAKAAGEADAGPIINWLRSQMPGGVKTAGPNPHLSPEEILLNCATCHSTKDRHVGLLGNDCASCHGTTKWTIPEFRHPLPVSQSCAQCHQAPPSHYMMHFKMVSMSIARMEKAEVRQCFLCHQTTSWNDIRGVGWYKHH